MVVVVCSRAVATVASSPRRRTAVPPPHATATTARDAAAAVSVIISPASYLCSRARSAPWEEVFEGHHALLVVMISIAIRIRLSAQSSLSLFGCRVARTSDVAKGGGSRAGTAPRSTTKAGAVLPDHEPNPLVWRSGQYP